MSVSTSPPPIGIAIGISIWISIRISIGMGIGMGIGAQRVNVNMPSLYRDGHRDVYPVFYRDPYRDGYKDFYRSCPKCPQRSKGVKSSDCPYTQRV